MSPTKTIQYLLLITLFQFSFQQSSNFLPNIIQNVDEATVGYGNQGVSITHEGGSTLDDSTFHFESIELENLDSDEWTVQWTDAEGEDYHLIDENGHIIQVGPNNSTEDVTDELANAAGIPESSVAGVIGTLAEDLVQKVDEKGGNVTLTGKEVYSEAVGPVTLAVINAKFSSSSIGSGIEDAGDKVSEAASTVGSTVSDGASDVKNAAEDVGDQVSDDASDAWNATKNAANTVGDKAKDIGNSIADAATDFGENVSEAAEGTWNSTKDAANTVTDKAQDVGNSIADAATDFGENVSDAAQDTWNDTKNAATTVADKTKDVADQVGGAVSHAVDSLKDGISSLFGN